MRAFYPLQEGVHLSFRSLVEQIVEEILAGNTDRFRVILQEYRDELLRMAFHFLRDWDDAQEVTQTTFIVCFRRLNRYNPALPFRPWLLSIHWNQCKTAAKKKQRQRLFFIPVEDTDPPVSEPSLGDEDLIHREIQKLPFRQRAAFILVEIENFSPQEAAQTLRCADSTLRVHLSRAKKKLRERLLQYGIGTESLR